MATLESFQSGSLANSNTLTLTKPTGLAVGDTLVAGITAHRNISGTVTLNTPSGWTLQESTNASSLAVMSVFTKKADSADVAASDFTFTSTGGSQPSIIGHLLRVSEYGLVAGETSISGTSSPITATGFTPTRANCLYLFFAAAHDNSGTQPALSTYAIVTDNPTWTEQVETQLATANVDSTLAFATATRAAVTATGNVSFVASVIDEGNLILLAISDQVDGSVTPVTETNVYALTPIQTAHTEFISDEPTTRLDEPTTWTNTTKSTSTWTNPDK